MRARVHVAFGSVCTLLDVRELTSSSEVNQKLDWRKSILPSQPLTKVKISIVSPVPVPTILVVATLLLTEYPLHKLS